MMIFACRRRLLVLDQRPIDRSIQMWTSRMHAFSVQSLNGIRMAEKEQEQELGLE